MAARDFATTTPSLGEGLFSSPLGGSLVFFEAELRFGVKVISPLTQPQNRQDGPNTPDYYRAHCLLLLLLFYE